MKKLILIVICTINALTLCAQSITTLTPVVATDTNAVCIGSAIDIPFWSLLVYTNNTYIVQLSDANGAFPATPTVINSMLNSNIYSPSISPYLPGSISGIIPNVPPGCNYYIRVVSTNPVTLGTPWGPFCVGQCDIETNLNTDLHFCVTNCSVAPLGGNTTITVGINTFDSTGTGSVYNSGNIFKTQLLSSINFAQIGVDGIFGEVQATHDAIMSIHVPCKDSLSFYGIAPGIYYLRTIATNTTQPNNALGSLIRVSIGATVATGPTVACYDYSTFISADTFCLGAQIYPMFSPYNNSDNSSYLWSISGYLGGSPFVSANGGNSNNAGFVFNFNPGTYTFSVQETNNGCVGPWSPLTTIAINEPPYVPIAGPSTLCMGETAHYSIPVQSGLTSGVWSCSNSNGIALNSTYSGTDVIGNSTGSFSLTILAGNTCGTSNNSKTITVNPVPPTPTITQAGNILTSSSVNGNQWYLNGVAIAGATNQNYTYTSSGLYIVIVSLLGCSSSPSTPFTIVGIEENKLNNSISISPNPFSSTTTITFSEEQKNTTIKIMNVLGECIQQLTTNNQQLTLDMSGLAKGVYFLSINSQQGIINRKIVKE